MTFSFITNNILNKSNFLKMCFGLIFLVTQFSLYPALAADKVHSCLFFISVIRGWKSSGSGDSNVVTDLRIIPAHCVEVSLNV